MIPINPSHHTIANPDNALRQQQSVYKSLNGGIALAAPVSTNNQGVYNKFAQDNGNGVMLRIGANGATVEQGGNWTSNPGDNLTISHGLGRKPMGFHVTDTEGPAQIYRVSPPTESEIVLATTNPAAAATVYIF